MGQSVKDAGGDWRKIILATVTKTTPPTVTGGTGSKEGV